jgi:hypothetical protein
MKTQQKTLTLVQKLEQQVLQLEEKCKALIEDNEKLVNHRDKKKTTEPVQTTGW